MTLTQFHHFDTFKTIRLLKAHSDMSFQHVSGAKV